jgi:hypothetical protein
MGEADQFSADLRAVERQQRRARWSEGVPAHCSISGNVPINKLYVTLLNGLGASDAGAPITRFGVADSNKLDAGITNPGELAALKA